MKNKLTNAQKSRVSKARKKYLAAEKAKAKALDRVWLTAGRAEHSSAEKAFRQKRKQTDKALMSYFKLMRKIGQI